MSRTSFPEVDAAAAYIRSHILAAMMMAFVLIGFYLASLLVPTGWLTYALSAPALGILATTALARVNDITLEHTALRWQVRRLGLVLAGAAAIMLILIPLVTQDDFPSWREVMIRWGMALTWLTTPHMPPWHRYITGQYRTVQAAKIAAVSGEVTGLDPKDDAPIYPQDPSALPADVPFDRRRGEEYR